MDSKPIGCSTKNKSDQAELKVDINKMQLGGAGIWRISQGIPIDSQKNQEKLRFFE
jgi:hypothetical protein